MSMDDPNEEIEPTPYDAVEKYRERLKGFKPTIGAELRGLPDDIPEVFGPPSGMELPMAEPPMIAPPMETGGCEHDYPDLDATDGAHPAWWRGHDHTTAVFCQKVHDILDGNDAGAGFGYEPWETLRRRLLAMVTKS